MGWGGVVHMNRASDKGRVGLGRSKSTSILMCVCL